MFIVVVQSPTRVWLFETPWTAACQAPVSFTTSWSLLKFIPIESMMLSDHLILCCPLLLVPSVFPSIRVFANEWALCISWPKYWSFSLNVHNWFPLRNPTNLVCLLINCASRREWSLFLCAWLHWLHYICKIYFYKKIKRVQVALLTGWTWVWESSSSWWWTRKPNML